MTEKDLTDRKFYRAEQESRFADEAPVHTPQTDHPAYKLAFRDTDFLLRDELRPVRFQLELLKPEMLLDEARVGSTMVMYGSARIPSPEEAQAKIDAAKDGSEYERPGRTTAVFTRSAVGDEWKCVHTHVSLARGVPQKSFGEP